MVMRKSGFRSVSMLAAALPVLFFNYCSPSITPPKTGNTSLKISTGDVVAVTTRIIDAAGGNITVSKPGDPLDGMIIAIPDSAYAAPKTFTVSYQPIQSHTFGSDFNPVSPLILIGNGGGYAGDLLTLKIPCKIPNGYFAMGFFYNETSGELEGIPVVNEDSASVTLVTRHLSNSIIAATGGLSKQAKSAGLTDDIAKIVISSIDAKLLETNIPTDFTVGHDDWEFPNYGTYITPGGSCAGQSLTAMWYFQFHKTAGDQLFNKYDSVHATDMWMDNPIGYRFTAVTQCDYQKQFNDPQKGQKVFLTYFNALAQRWDNIFRAFAYSMKLTGQPQYIAVLNGKTSHAMIAYRVMNVGANHILFPCDPNYPGQSARAILFDPTTVSFKPYLAGVTASAPTQTYTEIYYCAKTAIVDYATLASRWNEVQNGTIGNAQFPPVKIQDVTGAAATDLTDGYVSKSDTLAMSVTCPTCDDPADVYFKVYNRSGVKIDTIINSKHYIVLSPGNNEIGVYTYTLPLMDCAGEAVDPDILGTDLFRWLDFKWLRVSYQSVRVSINPPATKGEPNAEYAYTATVSPVQKTATYVWNFGDGTADVTKTNDTSATHTFTKSGTYAISLTVYNSSNQKLGQAAASAAIASAPPPTGDPAITSITPDSAIAEATITIHGNNFGPAQASGWVSASYLDSMPIVSWSDSQIIATIPLKESGNIFIAVNRKQPGDSWTHTTKSVQYNVYPDIFVTIKRATMLSVTVVGNLKQIPPNDTLTRYIQVDFGTFDRTKPITWSGSSLQLTRRDYFDSTPGAEIYTDWTIALNVGGAGATLSGTIQSHSIHNNVDTTAQDYIEMTFSGMKLYKFDKDFVTYSASTAEAKSCVSYLKDWEWYMKYEGFDTLSACAISIYR